MEQTQVLLELLKSKETEADAYATNIMRSIGLFLAVTGALLKFALDVNATKTLRLSLDHGPNNGSFVRVRLPFRGGAQAIPTEGNKLPAWCTR